MATSTFAPYALGAAQNYIQNAQMPNDNSAGRVPAQSNQLTSASNMNLSPGHQALAASLGNSLQSNNLQGLLASIINNPQLSQQLAGSQANPYTPAHPANAQELTGMSGSGSASGWQSLYPAGTPNLVQPGQSANQMGLGAVAQNPNINLSTYQQWLASQLQGQQ